MIYPLLFLCASILHTNQLHGMENPSELDYQPAQLCVQELEPTPSLVTKVTTISYSTELTTTEKVALLENLFLQALCLSLVKNPYEKQFYGPTVKHKRGLTNNVLINREVNFSSIMEFAVKARKLNIMEQAFSNGASPDEILEDTYIHQSMPAIAQALKYARVNTKQEYNITEQIIVMFKKYGVNFNIVVSTPIEQPLLHHHINHPLPLKALLLTHFVNEIDINQQDHNGDTVAHILPPIGNRGTQGDIFNMFIRKGLNPHIKNNEGKTAKEIALERCTEMEKLFTINPDPSRFYNEQKQCYKSNAHLLEKLEMGYSPNDRFILHRDLSITYQDSWQNRY